MIRMAVGLRKDISHWSRWETIGDILGTERKYGGDGKKNEGRPSMQT